MRRGDGAVTSAAEMGNRRQGMDDGMEEEDGAGIEGTVPATLVEAEEMVGEVAVGAFADTLRVTLVRGKAEANFERDGSAVGESDTACGEEDDEGSADSGDKDAAGID